ncbi:enoyl-CoA hydratase/isomerase family protein [Nocardia sp. NPDC051990]|uniref:enoyl-CoA hydratase/isomerase family protein n=1 Tax=Nocardia sp. NPDC051990 TaxID=3155285 RepID=UPI00341B097A
MTATTDRKRTPLRATAVGGLTIITMDHPPYNLFDRGMLAAWSDTLELLNERPPRGILVRAEGRIVSSGMDVEVFAETRPEAAAEFWSRQLGITTMLAGMPCPTVFAAHSLTLTAAFELALACDLIVAASSARFGLVENRIGFTPAMGGTQRLAERAGPARAKELVMTGDLYRATTLADWGVVNAIFDHATFHEDAYQYAMRVAIANSGSG